jgi:hypothetical protein
MSTPIAQMHEKYGVQVLYECRLCKRCYQVINGVSVNSQGDSSHLCDLYVAAREHYEVGVVWDLASTACGKFDLREEG